MVDINFQYWVVHLKRRNLIIFCKSQDGEYTSKLTLTSGNIQALTFPDGAIFVNAIITNY